MIHITSLALTHQSTTTHHGHGHSHTLPIALAHGEAGGRWAGLTRQ
ncbi:MAG: hypothetical protein PVG54_12460 [Anaerolineae bacterium]|jgi:hypothetical protein